MFRHAVLPPLFREPGSRDGGWLSGSRKRKGGMRYSGYFRNLGFSVLQCLAEIFRSLDHENRLLGIMQYLAGGAAEYYLADQGMSL